MNSYDKLGDHPVVDGADNPAALTLLTARGHVFTKTMGPSGKIDDGDKGWEFKHDVEIVDGLADLSGLLRWLDKERDTFVIRGAVMKTAGTTIRRKSRRNDPERSVVDAPRSWVMVDVDDARGYEVPADWRDRRDEVAREIVAHALPPEFHDAGVIVVWSSSMKPEGGAPKAHLWFWLSRPVWSPELKDWLTDYPVDHAVFQPVQQHYTASPIWTDSNSDEIEDPFGSDRVFLVEGPVVDVPDPLPRKTIQRARSSGSGGDYAQRGGNWKETLALFSDPQKVATPGFLHATRNRLQFQYIRAHFPNDDPEYLKQLLIEEMSKVRPHLTREREADLDARLDDFDRCYDGAREQIDREQNELVDALKAYKEKDRLWHEKAAAAGPWQDAVGKWFGL